MTTNKKREKTESHPAGPRAESGRRKQNREREKGKMTDRKERERERKNKQRATPAESEEEMHAVKHQVVSVSTRSEASSSI